jgi:hypothetical protein
MMMALIRGLKARGREVREACRFGSADRRNQDAGTRVQSPFAQNPQRFRGPLSTAKIEEPGTLDILTCTQPACTASNQEGICYCVRLTCAEMLLPRKRQAAGH